MSSAHNRYNLLFRQTHKTQMIHHLALLLLKNYIMIQVGTLQRMHRQYIRYESALDDTMIGIENLNSGYLPHRILDPQVLSIYLEAIEASKYLLSTCGSQILCVRYPEFRFSIPIIVSSNANSYLIYRLCILCKVPTCVVI